MTTIVGIFREPEFSPGRVGDDAAILEQTAAALRGRGATVRLGAPELALADDVDAVLAMCQTPAALAVLDRAALRVPVLNSAAAIRNCFRAETVRLLGAAGLPFPSTAVVATDAPATGRAPCWVKRGDVHAMHPDDVVFAADDAALTQALAAFRARGIARAALQAHVAGPVLKFYGTADGRFFRAYSDLPEAPAPIGRLCEVASAGARALGLDVFGGDLVVPADGAPVLIDVNDWPSFARCRDEAAEAIADHALARIAAAAPRTGAGGAADVADRGTLSHAG
ncbi:MAG TPA: hypothetical protein VGK30_07820 [Candidatus Binatia bacterium]|jgi:hypothetical protein